MRRDAVLLAEIVNAVGRILELTAAPSVAEIEVAPDSRDSLLCDRTRVIESTLELARDWQAALPLSSPEDVHPLPS